MKFFFFHLFNEGTKFYFILFFEDFQNYFRLKSISDLPLTLITLSFNTKNDMSTWNDEVETERESIIKKVFICFYKLI